MAPMIVVTGTPSQPSSNMRERPAWPLAVMMPLTTRLVLVPTRVQVPPKHRGVGEGDEQLRRRELHLACELQHHWEETRRRRGCC
jgi:hypothetical protein